MGKHSVEAAASISAAPAAGAVLVPAAGCDGLRLAQSADVRTVRQARTTVRVVPDVPPPTNMLHHTVLATGVTLVGWEVLIASLILGMRPHPSS